MEKLNNDLLTKSGFKQVNNSTFRLLELTAQNVTIFEGENWFERLINMRHGYKICYHGKFFRTIETMKELKEVIELVK